MNLSHIRFTTSENETIGQYPHSQAYGKCKALHTIGEWSNVSNNFKAAMLTNNGSGYDSESSIVIGESCKFYMEIPTNKLPEDRSGLLELIGEFHPVNTSFDSGGDSWPTTYWTGTFNLFGKDYKWQGDCVWEIMTIISNWIDIELASESFSPSLEVSTTEGRRVREAARKCLTESHGAELVSA